MQLEHGKGDNIVITISRPEAELVAAVLMCESSELGKEYGKQIWDFLHKESADA